MLTVEQIVEIVDKWFPDEPSRLKCIAAIQEVQALAPPLSAERNDAMRWRKLERLVKCGYLKIEDFRSPPWTNPNMEIDALRDADIERAVASRKEYFK